MSIADEVHAIAKKYLHKVKRSGPDNIMALCPFHDNRDSPSFTMSLSLGLYHCFSCQESGNLQQFLKSIGLAWNVIERQYKDLIEQTRKRSPKKNADPFVVARKKRTPRFLSIFSVSSIVSSLTAGRQKKDSIRASSRSSTSAWTWTTAASRFHYASSMELS